MADEQPNLEEFHQLAELDELRKTLATTQHQLRKAKAKTAELVEAVYQAAKDAAVVLGNPPAVPKPKVDRRTRKPEVALLHVSDLHFGKATPSFNSEVAAERLKLLSEKVLQITEIERADHPVREVAVLLGGDLAENLGIFPGQIYEVDSSTFAQVFAAVGALERLFRHLLSSFEHVSVDEVWGNHGRIGRKGDNPRGDNIDRFVGAILRNKLKEFEDSGRLTWRGPCGGWYGIVEIGEYRALLAHGDQIKSFGGTPAFAILKKCNSWSSGVLPTFRDVWMGHFHNPLVLPLANGRGRVFISPSIESDSAYAAEVVAAASVPAQRLCFVDPVKARVTAERLIWLDDGKVA